MLFYEIFEIEPRLQLDAAELQKRFYELSRRYHPDRNPANADKSALLNDAFRTLRNPVSRAEYFLRENGVTLNAGQPPPELLEEVFEFNLAVEEADAAELEKFRERFSRMLTELDAALGTAFEQCDRSPGPQALQTIASLLHRRKYLSNLVGAIDKTASNGHLSN